jgi:hypothetical protein
MNVKIYPSKVAAWLAVALAALTLLHGATVFVDRVLGHPRAFGFNALFYFSAEDNVPTLYSSFLMWIIAALALAMAMASRRREMSGVGAWLGIAAVFLFLGIDESASLHEKMSEPIREALGGVGGFLYFAYIIPYGIALAILTLVYWPFVTKLPTRTRTMVVVSAVLYIAGALALEAVGGRHYETMEVRDAPYILMITIEEFLEIAGLSLFLCAELEHVVERFGGAVVTLASERAAPALAADAQRGGAPYVFERTASR